VRRYVPQRLLTPRTQYLIETLLESDDDDE